MNGPEHYREAERLIELSQARPEGELDLALADAAAAQVHATLALFSQIGEIGDQLDTLPRKSGILTEDDVMRCPHGAVICGLCGYGVPQGTQS